MKTGRCKDYGHVLSLSKQSNQACLSITLKAGTQMGLMKVDDLTFRIIASCWHRPPLYLKQRAVRGFKPQPLAGKRMPQLLSLCRLLHSGDIVNSVPNRSTSLGLKPCAFLLE